jgi:hypothetical protein
LIRQATNGEIDRREFESRVEEITIALLLLAFLLGAKLSLSGLASNVLAQMTLSANEEIARNAAQNLANDIFINGRYIPSETITAERVEEQRNERTALWAGTILGLYAIGQTYRPDDPFLMWDFSPEKDHCADCARLNGQVHRASEWRASGWQPQSRSLQCRGYRCGCRFVEVEGPAQGSF